MLLTLLDFISRRLRAIWAYHTTVWALNSLTNRDLADLGIERSQIKFVARLDATRRFAVK